MIDDLDKIKHHANQILENLKEENGKKRIERDAVNIKNTAKELKANAETLYEERNRMMVERFRIYNQLGIDTAYKRDNDLEEWFVWLIPNQSHDKLGEIKQMGWHIHIEDIDPRDTPFVYRDNQEWDGHTTEDKLERLQKLDQRITNLILKEVE